MCAWLSVHVGNGRAHRHRCACRSGAEALRVHSGRGCARLALSVRKVVTCSCVRESHTGWAGPEGYCVPGSRCHQTSLLPGPDSEKCSWPLILSDACGGRRETPGHPSLSPPWGAYPAYSRWKGNASLKPVPNCSTKTPDPLLPGSRPPPQPSCSAPSHLDLKVGPAVVWILGAAGRSRGWGHLPTDSPIPLWWRSSSEAPSDLGPPLGRASLTRQALQDPEIIGIWGSPLQPQTGGLQMSACLTPLTHLVSPDTEPALLQATPCCHSPRVPEDATQ